LYIQAERLTALFQSLTQRQAFAQRKHRPSRRQQMHAESCQRLQTGIARDVDEAIGEQKSRGVLLTISKRIPVKDLSVNQMKNETMPAEEERRELIPVIIAGIVAVVGLFFLWSDLPV
jgi:hypothetical protein